jgi:hypothetical protein
MKVDLPSDEKDEFKISETDSHRRKPLEGVRVLLIDEPAGSQPDDGHLKKIFEFAHILKKLRY